MKIQCEVCCKNEASVICTADEAALCDACDHRVHCANKLASKHQRFSLLHPSPKTFPLCDICQRKRAFLFCQQDRAILCRDCDVPIHKANEHTQKHNRFLLTGVKLSANPAIYKPSSSSPSSYSLTNAGDLVPDSKSHQQQQSYSNLPPSSTVKTVITSNSTVNKASPDSNAVGCVDNLLSNKDVGSVSNISEYLMESLSGWHVEDFIDFQSSPLVFCQPGDEMLPIAEADAGGCIAPLSSESKGIWVRQVPNTLHPSQHYQETVSQTGLKEMKDAINRKGNNRRWRDDVLTVPQISSPSIGSKRSRSSR